VSVVTLVTELLTGVELDPGQLAELRAINSLYYTQVARSESASSASSASSVSSSALDDLVFARVREMLRSEQRILFDRSRAALWPNEEHSGARIERSL
jgi:hypothetical protein